MRVKSIAECSNGEHSALLLNFIKLPFVIKIFVLSMFKWPLKTGFTVFTLQTLKQNGYVSISIKKYRLFSVEYIRGSGAPECIFHNQHKTLYNLFSPNSAVGWSWAK